MHQVDLAPISLSQLGRGDEFKLLHLLHHVTHGHVERDVLEPVLAHALAVVDNQRLVPRVVEKLPVHAQVRREQTARSITYVYPPPQRISHTTLRASRTERRCGNKSGMVEFAQCAESQVQQGQCTGSAGDSLLPLALN